MDVSSGTGANGDSARSAVVLMTRVPVAGKVKTRLGSVLTAGQCAQLQEALTLDTVEKLSSAGAGRVFVVCYSDEARGLPEGSELQRRFLADVGEVGARAAALHIVAQQGDSLGARMRAAVDAAFGLGVSSCLLIGGDTPTIVEADLSAAERALARYDVVLGPSHDGGFWLLGLNEPFPELFSGKRYGGATVFAEALAECRAGKRSVGVLREARDVDVADDLRALCVQARAGDARLGWRTARFARSLSLGADAQP